jgi:hypothetical protein
VICTSFSSISPSAIHLCLLTRLSTDPAKLGDTAASAKAPEIALPFPVPIDYAISRPLLDPRAVNVDHLATQPAR